MLSDGGGGDAAGEEAEVAAADGDREAVDLGRGGGKFLEVAVFCVERVDLFFRVGHAVAVVAAQRENAAVVGEALLG